MAIADDGLVACSSCFTDSGLRIDAERIGLSSLGPCRNCGIEGSKKLTREALFTLADRYFVWGSIWRARFGATPLVQFNEHEGTSIDIPPWLEQDVRLFERILKIGFFYYAPRFWMLGEIDPLIRLCDSRKRSSIVERILREYPERFLTTNQSFYRLRLNPSAPSKSSEYDSPPMKLIGRGRLDMKGRPVLYGSSDLETCIHECRVSAEDDIFVATLSPTKPLHLLDLTALLCESDEVTEFESLDLAVHMLFLAGRHSYRISRSIAEATRLAGYDGLLYPSYFSLLRLGNMPFQSIYGISLRRISEFHRYEQSMTIPNLALFGRPLASGAVEVKSIDRLIISKVIYDYHFGITSD